jgi:hypothetical protein
MMKLVGLSSVWEEGENHVTSPESRKTTDGRKRGVGLSIVDPVLQLGRKCFNLPLNEC